MCIRDRSVVDVSFISLKIVLPAIQKLLKPTGQVLCLIKPQFEAGKENVGKKGVVRDPAVHAQVLRDFTALVASLNFTIRNLTCLLYTSRFVRLTAALDAMSPLKVLSRGYSMVTDESGKLVTSASTVRLGQRIHISLRSGCLAADVQQIQEEPTDG